MPKLVAQLTFPPPTELFTPPLYATLEQVWSHHCTMNIGHQFSGKE